MGLYILTFWLLGLNLNLGESWGWLTDFFRSLKPKKKTVQFMVGDYSGDVTVNGMQGVVVVKEVNRVSILIWYVSNQLMINDF